LKKKDVSPPEGKKFYGSVTVSERGQIVIPAEARKDFNIRTGDKLLVFGDLDQGIWIATLANIQKLMANSDIFFKMAESAMNGSPENRNREK
jgi:AbrB family looped-hinge helix DNA binding protein